MKQKKQSKAVYVIIVVVLVLAFSFYYSNQHPPFNPDFSAIILDVKIDTDGTGSLLLTYENFPGYAPGEISVFVHHKTTVLLHDTTVKNGFYLFENGNQVEIALEGPVRESYPLQGDAKYIRILK